MLVVVHEAGIREFSRRATTRKGRMERNGKAHSEGSRPPFSRKPPRKRHPDGDGLFFKTTGQGKAYWTARYTLGKRERETSLGPFPEVTLDEARIKHLELRAAIAKGTDPVAKRSAKAMHATPGGTPTFGQCADQFIALNEGGWKNSKHHAQWVATLKTYAAPIRDLPVDQVDTKAILNVLTPIWSDKSETASRLRGRIEKVLASAQVDGWIPEDRSNPARWKNWLERKLPKPKKLAHGHHAAMDYRDLPALMAKLAETSGVASRALQFTILTCARTSETLGMTWDEVDLESATWRVPKERMKMANPHDVPLSDPALAILPRA